MRANIPIDGLSSQELLSDWQWLLKKPHIIVAMNNFGDMFLRDENGQVYFLSIAFGDLTKVANSVSELRQLTTAKQNQCRCRFVQSSGRWKIASAQWGPVGAIK
jgi:hypothetical protein